MTLGYRDFATFNEIVAPLIQELNAFLAALHANPVFVMTQILFKEYFAKISDVVNELVSKKDSFSPSNSCLIQHVTKNIMASKQKWKEIEKKVPEAIVIADHDDHDGPIIQEEDVKNLETLLENLIKLMEHFIERMKTNDLQQEQLELAYVIGSLWGQRKVKYYMVCTYLIFYVLIGTYAPTYLIGPGIYVHYFHSRMHIFKWQFLV